MFPACLNSLFSNGGELEDFYFENPPHSCGVWGLRPSRSASEQLGTLPGASSGERHFGSGPTTGHDGAPADGLPPQVLGYDPFYWSHDIKHHEMNHSDDWEKPVQDQQWLKSPFILAF